MMKQNQNLKFFLEISPAVLWRAVTGCGRRYILLGDDDHRSHDIRRAVVKSIEPLASGGVAALASEDPVTSIGSIIDAFNKASVTDRAAGRDQDLLRQELSQIFFSWDVTEAQQQERRAIFFNQIVAARTHGLALCPISALHTSLVDYIPDLTADMRARLTSTLHYRETHNGQWPASYQSNPLLKRLDSELMATGLRRLLKKNLELDYDRAMILKGLAQPDKRVGIFYGDGHFRGAQETGIDSHLPQDQLVYVRIIASALAQPPINIVRRSPDFVLDSSTSRAFVTETALERGLWPKPSVS